MAMRSVRKDVACWPRSIKWRNREDREREEKREEKRREERRGMEREEERKGGRERGREGESAAPGPGELLRSLGKRQRRRR
jgi:hypothetical protein